MSQPCKRSDHKTARNLDMFWAVHRDGLTQDQVAAVFGVTQQRVSAIVRNMALFVALAPSEEYDHIPQMGQLQFGHRIWQEKLKARRTKLVQAFDASMQPVTSMKELAEWDETPLPIDAAAKEGAEGAKGAEGAVVAAVSSRHCRRESFAKTQHGDWHIDRQIERIDKELFESRILCYGRPWKGWEELEKMPKPKRKAKSGKRREEGMSNDEIQMSKERQSPKHEGAGMRNSEVGMRNGGEGCDAVVGETVLSTEYSVPSTEPVVAEVVTTEPPAEPVVVAPAEPVAEAPPSPLPPPPSPESAIRNPQSAIPAKRVPPPPISKITGKRFLAPRQEPAETLIAHGLNPDDYGAVPAAVLYDTTPRWITGPDPREVLLRDVDAMTDEEYEQHRRDVAFLESHGVCMRRDTRPVIRLVEGPSFG